MRDDVFVENPTGGAPALLVFRQLDLFARAGPHFDEGVRELHLEAGQKAHAEQPVDGGAVAALVGLLHDNRDVGGREPTERDPIGVR